MLTPNIVAELEMQRDELVRLIHEIDIRLEKYHKGTLVNQNGYVYLKYYENGKVISKYIGSENDQEKIQKYTLEIKNHKALKNRKKEYQADVDELNRLLNKFYKHWRHPIK